MIKNLAAGLIYILVLSTIGGCLPAGIHGGNEEIHGSETPSPGNSHGEQIVTDEGHFPTIGLEERVELTVPFPTTEVCPLFEPAGRFLMYDWWSPTILQEAEGETLEGLIMSDHGFGLDTLLKVTKHIPDEGYIRYIVLWGDFELQRIDITCVEGDTADSTKIVWNEKNTGMYENGASAVTTYVTGGHLRNNVETYVKNASKYLQSK